MMVISLASESPLTLKEQVLLFHHCHRFLKSGLPVTVGLAHVLEHASGRLARLVCRLEQAVSEQRLGLAAAFKAHLPGGDPFVLAMIEQGEASGRLDEVFAELETTAAGALERRRKVASDLAYPSFLVVAFLLLWPVPKLVNESTAAYLACAVPPVAALLVVLLGWIFVWPRVVLAPHVVLSFHRLQLRLPFLGALFRAMLVARFGRSLGLLVKAGLQMDRALDLAAGAAGNAYLRLRVLPVVESVREGKRVSDSLKSLKDILPPTFFSMVKTGEESGDLETSLVNVSELYEQEARTATETALRLLGPLMNVVVLLAIGAYVISFYSGYLNQLGNIH